MDPDKDIAEERLLRVIEKSQARTPSASGHRQSLNPIHWFRMWLARRYAQPVGKNSDLVLRLLKILSFFLWLGLIGFGAYFGYNYAVERQMSFQQRLAPKSPTLPIEIEAEVVATPKDVKPDSYYVGALQNPNPFTGAGEEKVQVVEVDRGPSPKEKLSAMTKNLVIVGINRGPVPDAIIEDSEQKRTFFVKVGDSINELSVKEVKHDSVVLGFENETIEIG